MHLVGYQFSGASGPLPRGFLSLADLTVLFGANDVGKSRLLRAIAEGCGALDALLHGRSFTGDHRFFVKLHPTDARLLLQATYRQYLDELESHGVSEQEGYEKALPWLDYLPADARDLDPRRSTFALEVLEDWCGKPTGEAGGLLVSWCRDASPDAMRRRSEDGDGSVPMGTVGLPFLPVAIELPLRDSSLVGQSVADVTTDLLAHLSWGLKVGSELEGLRRTPAGNARFEEWLNLTDKFFKEVENPPPRASLWTVQDEGGSIGFRPLVRAACRFVSEIATRLAPGFVTDRYSLEAEPVSILEWSDTQPVRIALRDSSGRSFQLDEIADGLKTWVEIAFFEAADSLRRVELGLRSNLFEIERSITEEASGPAIAAYLARLNEASTKALDPPFERSLEAAFALAPGIEAPSAPEVVAPASTLAERIKAARPRLYVIDEPERHLNPRLQREAADWLSDTLHSRGSQGIIATHAPAFLNLQEGPQFVAVRRDRSGVSTLSPLDPRELTAYSEIAKDVGLDRGELLTRIRLLAFVEGRHDQTVLEELFREPLFHAGVAIIPIAGVGRHSQIVEHEVLLRFTRAPLAVIFDKLDRETIDRLVSNAQFRNDSLRARQTELQAMASLLENAALHGRSVQPVPLPVDDIFDALDEGILRDQYPAYPGHAKANDEWLEQRKKVSNRKAFYENRYGVPNSRDTYKRVASLMKAFDRIPPVLKDLSIDLERLAAEGA